jgi:hypothetical protein
MAIQTIHPSLTVERIMDAVERQHTTLDDPGFCLICGFEQGGCEPDARDYTCESCGEDAVMGAEELMMEIL